MFGKGFPVLSFVDLLACALGASILLMLIFSVSGGQPAGISGAPRDYILYTVTVDHPDARLRLMIKSPKNKTYVIGDMEEYRDKLFQKMKVDGAVVFFMGPAQRYDVTLDDAKLNTTKKVYRIYSTFQDLGTW